MRKQWITAFALLGLGLAGPAQVLARGGGGGQKFMHYFDSNQDGMVTGEEFRDAAARRFRQMDRDNNGSISAVEFQLYVQTRRGEHRQQRFLDMDSSKDGQISREEFLQSRRQRAEHKFDRLDKNGDGLVSAEEFASGRHNKHGHYRHFGGRRIFQRLDANHDGVVTRAEGMAAWNSWFKRLDTNKDQVVSRDEVEQARGRQ